MWTVFWLIYESGTNFAIQDVTDLISVGTHLMKNDQASGEQREFLLSAAPTDRGRS